MAADVLDKVKDIPSKINVKNISSKVKDVSSKNQAVKWALIGFGVFAVVSSLVGIGYALTPTSTTTNIENIGISALDTSTLETDKVYSLKNKTLEDITDNVLFVADPTTNKKPTDIPDGVVTRGYSVEKINSVNYVRKRKHKDFLESLNHQLVKLVEALSRVGSIFRIREFIILVVTLID